MVTSAVGRHIESDENEESRAWLGRVTHAQRHTFTLRHDYRDGAVSLAAKVLANCIANPTKEADR